MLRLRHLVQIAQKSLIRARGRRRPENPPGNFRLDAVHQVREQRISLILVLHQRVALPIRPQAHPLPQRVHVAQIFLPLRVHRVQHDEPLHRIQLRRVLQRALVGIRLPHPLENRLRRRRRIHPLTPPPALVANHLLRMKPNRKIAIHPRRQRRQTVLLVVQLLRPPVNDVLHHIQQMLAHLLRRDNLAAEAINNLPLLVHHVVIFQRALANRKILLLHSALRRFNRTIQPPMLQHLPLLQPQLLHNPRNAVRAKQPHQIIFQRNKEPRHPRVPLPRATSAQLTVNPARLMPLAPNHIQTRRPLLNQLPERLFAIHLVRQLHRTHHLLALHPDDALAQLDVRSAPRHVRGNRNRARLPRIRHNFRLALVILRIQHIMRHIRPPKHPTENLRHIHRNRPHQHRLFALITRRNFLDNRVELLALRLVNLVVPVHPPHRTVRRNNHHIHLVNGRKLIRLRLRRARHPRQLLVKAEIILNRNRRQRLRLPLNAHPLLRLNRLMQPVAPAPPRHQTPRVLIHNHHLIVLHHILHIALIHAIRPNQLVHRVNPLALVRELILQLLTPLKLLLVAHRIVAIQLRQRAHQVRHHVIIRVLRIHRVAPLVRQTRVIALFINHKEQFLAQRPRLLLVHVHQHHVLDPLQQPPVLRLLQQMQKLLVLRHPLAHLIQLEHRGVLVALLQRRLHLIHQPRAQIALTPHHPLHRRPHQLILLRRIRRRPRNNQRRARLINQNRVHLVHDGVIPPPLHHLLRAVRHPHVAQIVEPEL